MKRVKVNPGTTGQVSRVAFDFYSKLISEPVKSLQYGDIQKKKRKSIVLSLSPRDQKRDLRLRKKYKLTLEQWNLMLKRQQGKCGICLTYLPGEKRIYTDHDHGKGKRVRGILCYTCNYRLLGRGLENPWLHRRAADYLESDYDGRQE